MGLPLRYLNTEAGARAHQSYGLWMVSGPPLLFSGALPHLHSGQKCIECAQEPGLTELDERAGSRRHVALWQRARSSRRPLQACMPSPLLKLRHSVVQLPEIQRYHDELHAGFGGLIQNIVQPPERFFVELACASHAWSCAGSCKASR